MRQIAASCVTLLTLLGLLVGCGGGDSAGPNAGFNKDALTPVDLVDGGRDTADSRDLKGRDGAGDAALDLVRDTGLDQRADSADVPSDLGPQDALDSQGDLAADTARPDLSGDLDGVPDAACQPVCTELSCAPNGCGQACPCPDGYACGGAPDLECLPDCVALCGPRVCGPAGLADECNCGVCDDANFCTEDFCLPDGTCSQVDNSRPCDDGNPCTKQDTCAESACAGLPLSLPELALAGCFCEASEDCAFLDDGDPCNGTLECPAGEGTRVCQVKADSIPDCADDEPCTLDQCLEGLGCSHDGLSGISCADDDLCDGAEACVDGTCQPGTPVVCEDPGLCANASCDPALGCVFEPVNDGLVCGALGSPDRCLDGQCICPPNCVNKQCGTDGCGGSCGACPPDRPCVDGRCVCVPNCAGKKCGDDGCGGSCGTCSAILTCVEGVCACLPDCTGKECGTSCTKNCGTCQEGWQCLDFKCFETVECMLDADCDDSEPCTEDLCRSHACQHNCLLGGTCNDGVADNKNDRCKLEGEACVCKGEAQCVSDLDCEDSNPCTLDYCDAEGVCHQACSSQACNDGNPMTMTDRCTMKAGGSCLCEGTPVQCTKDADCDDQVACTNDSCNKTTGKCVHDCSAGFGCDDGLPQTTNDSCKVLDGQCTCSGVFFECLEAKHCDDGNGCTTDTCNNLKCQHSCNQWTTCGSRKKCMTSGSSCICGSVSCTESWHCNDGNGCTSESCGSTGSCSYYCYNGYSCGKDVNCWGSGAACWCY
jgi:hypothetical protein